MRVVENENTQNVIAGKQVIGGRTLTGRITSNFLWYIISEATAKGVFFITNIYLARTFDVSSFGGTPVVRSLVFIPKYVNNH